MLIFHNPITHYLAVKHYCQTFRNRLASIRSAWSAEIKEHVVSVLSSRHRVWNVAAALTLRRSLQSHITTVLQQLHWLPVNHTLTR